MTPPSTQRRTILAAFGAALALLAVFSTASYRVGRAFIEDSRAVIRIHETLEGLDRAAPPAKDGKPGSSAGAVADLRRLLEQRSAVAAADADRLSKVLILGGVARALVVILALLALLWGIAARAKVEETLRLARDEALRAAEELRIIQAESEKLGERLHTVLDHIDVGVLMVDVDGRMSVYNLAAERIHGAWREQMEALNQAGTHPAMLEDEKTVIAPGESPLGLALKGQTVRDARLFLRTPFRPRGYHLKVSAFPLRDHRGMMAGAVVMFSEIVGSGRTTNEG